MKWVKKKEENKAKRKICIDSKENCIYGTKKGSTREKRIKGDTENKM
jgi:hypothetical protein